MFFPETLERDPDGMFFQIHEGAPGRKRVHWHKARIVFHRSGFQSFDSCIYKKYGLVCYLAAFAKSCLNVVLPSAMVHVVAVEVLGSKLLSVREEKLVEASREVPREMGKNAVSVQNNEKSIIFELFLEKMH